MALYPGAVYKPTRFGGRTKRNRQGRGILHVAVSGGRSLAPWNGNTWHFYVAFDGYCEQYVDTDYRAYASGDANDDAIHIETAGGLGSSKVLNAEKWTPAQMARIADIMRWEASQPGGAPLELLPDSKPGRRGWGPHRLGVTHSRGLGAVPGWRVPGGESWSSSIGKECPGDAKIRQIPTTVEMARAAGTATARRGLFMYLTEPEERFILEAAKESRHGMKGVEQGRGAAFLRAMDAKLERAAEDSAVARKLAEATAKGGTLSDADIERIGEETAEQFRAEAERIKADLAAGIDVDLVVTPKSGV